MPEQPSPNATAETLPDQPWNHAPVITLLAVIVLWYIGAITVALAQAL
jgi:hypothetical protein